MFPLHSIAARPRASRLQRLIPCLFPLAAVLGCSQSVEQSKAFKTEVARVDRIDEDMQVAMRQLSMLDGEAVRLDKEFKDLKTQGGLDPASIKTLDARLRQVELSLKTASETVVSLNERLGKLEKKGEQLVASAQKSDSASETLVARVKVKQPADSEPAVELPSRPGAEKPRKTESAPRSQSRAAVGFYHHVKSGETLTNIAQRYKVSADKLRDANHLPGDRRLIAGTQLYVPVPAG